jgi:hypothetical protein
MTAGSSQRSYRLYYDDDFLGELTKRAEASTEAAWQIDSIAEAAWPVEIRSYADLCRVHHRHLLAEEAGEALALEKALSESACALGEHLWYLVDSREGKSHKIWFPYFGCEGFLRYAFASPRLQYEVETLARYLENWLALMREGLSEEGEGLASDSRTEHAQAIVRLSDLALQLSKAECDPYKIVKEWFQELDKLSSPLTVFSNPRARRALDQQCAVPGQ